MLPVGRYVPGGYPPANSSFPHLGGARVTQYFKKYGEAPNPHLAGMTQRRKAVTDIHMARVNATMQSAAIPSNGLEQWYDANDGISAPQSTQAPAPTPAELPEPTAEVGHLPAPTGSPVALGPRPDRIGAAVRATSAGVRLIGGLAQATMGHATVGSQRLLGAGIQAGIAVTPLISAVGDALSAAGPPLLSGGSAVMSGLGHAAVATAAVAGPPLLSSGVALASGLGHVAVGVTQGAGSAIGSMAGAVAQGITAHGPEIYYMGSTAFKELYDLIAGMPEIPSLEIHRGSDLALYSGDSLTPWSSGHGNSVTAWSSPVNNALTYGNMKGKRRSSSPSYRATPPYTVPEPRQATGYREHHNHVISHDTPAEWEGLGRGVLGAQLMNRPGYIDAIKGMNRSYTTKILGKLSPAEMIHLLLKLDGKLK